MKKRWISTVTAAAIIAGSLAVSTYAADEVTIEKLKDGWQEKMEAAESLSLSQKLDLEMAISIFGQKMSIDMLCDFGMETVGSNAHLKGDMQMKAITPDGEENENAVMEMYVVPETDGSGYSVYGNNGDGWKHTTSENQQNLINPQTMMYMDNISLTEGTVTISVNDETYECYELTGTVPFSDMNNTLQMTGGDVAESFGVGDLDDVDAEIPAKMYFDAGTEDLVMMELEGSDVIREKILEAIKEEASIPMIPGLFEIDIPSFTIVIDSISLNTTDEIVVPDDVISTAEETDSLDFAP